MATATGNGSVTSSWVQLATGATAIVVQWESGASVEVAVGTALPAATFKGHALRGDPPGIDFALTATDKVYVRTAGGTPGDKATIVYTTIS